MEATDQITSFYADFVAGTARKFYQVDVESSTTIHRWGRIGTSGQSTTRTHSTHQAALRVARDTILSKVRKGYVERTALQAFCAAFEVRSEIEDAVVPAQLQLPDTKKNIEDCKKLSAVLHDISNHAKPLHKALVEQYNTIIKRLRHRETLSDDAVALLLRLAHEAERKWRIKFWR